MRINPTPPATWQELQSQVAQILQESGLKTDIERTIRTARGTVKVDVFALDEFQNPPLICLCECKLWSTPVTKEKVHAFRTVVSDFGASWGFLISAKGFQKGAQEAAEYSNVRLMTWEEFESAWIGRWTEHHLRPRLFEAHESVCDFTEPLLDKRLVQILDKLPEERQRQFISLRKNPSMILPAAIAMHYGAPWHNIMPNTEFKLPLNDHDPLWAAQYAPPILSSTDSLRQFGMTLCSWISEVLEKFQAVLHP